MIITPIPSLTSRIPNHLPLPLFVLSIALLWTRTSNECNHQYLIAKCSCPSTNNASCKGEQSRAWAPHTGREQRGWQWELGVGGSRPIPFGLTLLVQLVQCWPLLFMSFVLALLLRTVRVVHNGPSNLHYPRHSCSSVHNSHSNVRPCVSCPPSKKQMSCQLYRSSTLLWGQ